jgi:hypothetical protein
MKIQSIMASKEKLGDSPPPLKRQYNEMAFLPAALHPI